MTDLPLAISALYAALNGALLLVLAFRVSLVRRRKGIAVLDGGDPELIRAQRAHGNAVEYVPAILVMLVVLELNGLSPVALHLLGMTLFLSRIAHAVAFARTTGPHPLRIVGVLGTWGVLALAAALLLWQVIAGS